MKYKILFLLIFVLLISGCELSDELSNQDNDMIVNTHCEDGVVCYHSSDWIGEAGCFRDKDLVEKYCDQKCQPSKP